MRDYFGKSGAIPGNFSDGFCVMSFACRIFWAAVRQQFGPSLPSRVRRADSNSDRFTTGVELGFRTGCGAVIALNSADPYPFPDIGQVNPPASYRGGSGSLFPPKGVRCLTVLFTRPALTISGPKTMYEFTPEDIRKLDKGSKQWASRLNDPAIDYEDFKSEAMIRIVRRMPDYDPSKCLRSTWFWHLARTAWIEFARRKYGRFHHRPEMSSIDAMAGFEEWTADAQDPFAMADLMITLELAWGDISERERRIAVQILEGETIPEIAAVEGCSPSRIHQLKQRAYTRAQAA